MNKLVDIVLRWKCYQEVYHADVQKMCNTIKFDDKYWCFQRYIWQQDLDPNIIPDEKVIKTLIYVVKPNMAERGLRETARLSEAKYPDVSQVVQKDVYVDDCLSGKSCIELAHQRANELVLVLK